ncbi:MFS transporter [Xylogone sp. PMI_703]|nr:MFS transporter [Xylogone sp. PMI_703]
MASPTPVERHESMAAHWKCLVTCCLIAFCPFEYGLDFGCIGGLQAMPGFLQVFGYVDPSSPVGYNITPVAQQLISSLLILGTFISALAAGPIAKFIGRKFAMWIGCVLCAVANVIMMTSTQLGGLYVGRLLIGIANGFLMTFSQLWLQECAPARYRGFVVGAFTTAISIDNYTVPLGGRKAYEVPLAVVYVVPGLIFIGLWFVPESPRWLLTHGDEDKSLRALMWLRPFPELVPDEFAKMKAAIAEEALQSRGKAAVIEMFANPVDRRRTILSVASLLLQAGCGAIYLISYGTYFFEMARIGSPFANSCILSGVATAAIMVNAAVITRWGKRRYFMFSGLCITGTCQFIIAAVYKASPGTESTGRIIVAFSVIYIVAFNSLISTYSWLGGGEFPSQRLRSYTFGLATSMGFLGIWLIAFTAPYFINPAALNWGPQYGFIWGPSSFICATWVYFYFPEVKDRTFEEIDEMFQERLPARKFSKYVCTRASTSGKDNDSVHHVENIAMEEKSATKETTKC